VRLASWLLVAAWLVVALLHLALPTETRLWVWPLSYLFLEALATASLAQRAWHTMGGGRMAWWLLAASACLEVPNLCMSFLEARGHLPPMLGVVSTLLTLATGILVLAGVLSFPKEPDRGPRFLRRVLDSLIFATALLFLLWVMGVPGSLRQAGQGVGLRIFVAYLNVALLGGGLVFMTSYHPNRFRGPLGWLGASALAWLAGISLWTLAGLPAQLYGRSWIIVVGGIPLFQGLAAWSPRPVEPDLAAEDPRRRLLDLLPYLPVLLTILTLAAILVWRPHVATRQVIALFLGLVVLLLLRQLQAVRDLLAAQRTLEERVRERTATLQQAQDTLIRTERMNTLASMGAGLAHDLNNLLGAVKASADLAVMRLEEGITPRVEELQRIAGAADRAANLTRRLMEFARRELEELAPIDLIQEVAHMELTLRLLLPRTVELSLTVPKAETLVVKSSRLRLEQMLVNLVANARDAMPQGGRLSIRVASEGPSRQLAMVEVSDTGVGMSAEVQARIFDPFFTTKAPGEGTGLGLSSLKAMVEEGGGRLSVQSEPGRGTRFRILLPLHSEEPFSPR
jgi:signal transduction histidine kinase